LTRRVPAGPGHGGRAAGRSKSRHRPSGCVAVASSVLFMTRPCSRRPQVIPDLGLGVTLYEILDVQGGTIYPLEGAALYTVTFSVVRLRVWERDSCGTGLPPQGA
jgi:hypothetical protein